MKKHRIGIILNGVTGRMGTNQHLERSILAIRRQGGVTLGPDELVVPDPILVGRNEKKLRSIAEKYGLERYTTDLDSCLSDRNYSVYFDALKTELRSSNVLRALAAGKHVYCEKPTAGTLEEAVMLYRKAGDAGVKHGVVQDKLWLSGLRKLKYLVETGFFGDILSVRCEFGYWVFDGFHQSCQRPSWNYRREEGGGILLDMFSHWRYILDNLFGRVKAVSCFAATHVGRRVNEEGEEYKCTAEDAAYATFLCESGTVCQFSSSWAVRVRRDDLLVFQVDGTKGSAAAGLRDCWIQPDASTPRPVWNPDIESPIDYFAGWEKMPDNLPDENAFKAQWELYLRHIAADDPFPWDLLEGAKGVQLAELARQSWQSREWVDIPPLS